MKDTKAKPNFGNLGKEEVDELKVGYQFHQLIPVEILKGLCLCPYNPDYIKITLFICRMQLKRSDNLYMIQKR